jgi:hypothetical protein
VAQRDACYSTCNRARRAFQNRTGPPDWQLPAIGKRTDDDGDDDLLFADTQNGALRVLGNRGDGTFADVAKYFVGPGVGSVALAELDGYPGLEIAALNAADSTLSVFPGHGSPVTEVHTFATQDQPWIIVATDLDADGIADPAIVNGGSPSGFSALLTRCQAVGD